MERTEQATAGAHRVRRAPDVVAFYIAALAALAVAAAGAASALPAPAGAPAATTIATLIALVIAAEVVVVRMQYRGDVMALSLGEAMLAPAIVLMPAALVILTAAAAQIASGITHRIGIRKTLFNVAQWSLGTAVAAMTFDGLHLGGQISARNAGALLAAMTALAAVNALAFVGVIALSQRRGPRTVAGGLLAPLGLGWVVNTSFGIMFVATGLHSAPAIGLFVVPLALLHWASRGHAAAVADRTRLSGLHRAMQILTEPIRPEDAIPRFLTVVSECFQSEAAELVLVGAGGRTIHRVRPAGTGGYERETEEGPGTLAAVLLARAASTLVDRRHRDATLEERLRPQGWNDCLAAPLITDEGTIGVLAVFDRTGHEGFEDGEMAVLEALAAEVAGAIQKGVLLERLLAESRKLADVVENTADGITMLDECGTILMWNPGLEAITGYAATEMVGRRMMSGLLPRDADGEVIHLEAGVSPDVTLPADLQIVAGTGETRWLSCSYTRIAAVDGRGASLIVVARDVTRSRELERLKEDFVATVSHELRTPLTPIKGWASTLIDSGDRLGPEERAAAAHSILRQAEGLERLIVNLLEVSKIERGVIDLRDAVVDVKGVVTKVVADAQQQYPMRAVRIDAGPGHCRARGDEVWVERIVSNLVSNAMKYSPADETISISIAEAPGQITVSVSDGGPGIPAHETERIFERFQRLGNHLTRATGGTGLGLYIARQLAQALGGSLGVTSEPGHGATFTLSLRASERRLVAVG